MTLQFQNGARLNLRQQRLFLFGRANQEHPDVHTSRQHCSLQLLNQGNNEVLQLVSLSKSSPTQVYRASTSTPEILCTGQHALLKHNDRFSTGAGLELFRVDLQQGEPQRQQPIIQDFQPAGDSSQVQEQQQQQVTRAHESVLQGDYSKVQEQQHRQQQEHEQQQQQQRLQFTANGTQQQQQQQQQRAMPQEDCVHIKQSALHTALPQQQQGPVEELIDVVCQPLPSIDVGIHGNDSQQAKGQKFQINEVQLAQTPLQEAQGKHVWKDGADAVCQPLSSSSQQEKGLVHELQPHKLQPAQSPLHIAQRKHECEGEDLLPQSKRQRASSSPATKPADTPSTEGASAGTEAATSAAAGAAAAGNEAPRAVGPHESPYAAGSGAGHAAVMLILMGVNGSGKSTFSQALAQTSYMPFVRVNQDTISSKGTPGSRKQCVAAAQRALRSGKSVIIDRCNLNADQRKDFVNLAAQLRASIHAVVLDLPFETCLSRAMARTNHPSGKHGKEVVPIVYSMRREMMNGTVPSAMEGFQSVRICKTDEEVAATLQAWQRYGTGPGPGSPGGPSGDGTVEQPYQPQSPAVAQQQQQQQQQHPGPGNSSVPFEQPGSSGAAATAAAAATTGGAAALVPSEGVLNNSGSSSRGVGSSGGNSQAGGSAKKGKKPPPAASAASVNLMRSLFSRPHQAVPQGVTASTPGAPYFSTPAMLLAPEACQPSPSAPPHPLGRSHSDSAAATAAAAAGTVVEGVHGSRAAPAAAVTAPPLPSPQPPVPTQPPRPHRVWNHHQQALYYMAQDTSKIDRREQKDAHVDDLCLRIRDIYPKGHYHALVVAREPGLDSVEDLQPKHLPLLDHMRHVAMQYVLQCQQQHPRQQRLVFRLGFHSIPSCRQLHLHVVSQDLCGPNMKKKEHYQRFTTPFFITLDEVEKQLREHGHVACDQAQAHAFLGGQLKCHRCGAGIVNFPRIKDHLASCTALYTGPGAVHAPDAPSML